MTVICKQLLEKFHFEFLLVHVGKILTFRHNIAYMVNSFFVSLEIPVMMSSIKILHQEMLNAIYLY